MLSSPWICRSLTVVLIKVFSVGYKSNINNLIKQHTAITFCFKAGLSAKNAFKILKKGYGQSCL